MAAEPHEALHTLGEPKQEKAIQVPAPGDQLPGAAMP